MVKVENANSFNLSPKASSRTLKGFDPDHYRVSPSTTIVVDLGPL